MRHFYAAEPSLHTGRLEPLISGNLSYFVIRLLVFMLGNAFSIFFIFVDCKG